MIYDDETIAEAIHLMNGFLQRVHRERPLQPDWKHAPGPMKARVVALVRGYRAGITPREAHDRWVTAMKGDGWVLGERKNPHAAPPTHPNLVDYAELTQCQRVKDTMSQQITMVLVAGGER
jgi:hypothetical protein